MFDNCWIILYSLYISLLFNPFAAKLLLAYVTASFYFKCKCEIWIMLYKVSF